MSCNSKRCKDFEAFFGKCKTLYLVVVVRSGDINNSGTGLLNNLQNFPRSPERAEPDQSVSTDDRPAYLCLIHFKTSGSL